MSAQAEGTDSEEIKDTHLLYRAVSYGSEVSIPQIAALIIPKVTRLSISLPLST